MPDSSINPGPLSGYRIIDLTGMISGPMATMLLADQGADVIKIENPNGGDHTRAVATRRSGFSASFLNNNRNKRSVAINLKDPRGIDILKQLVVGADVMIQNFRPGVAERMGIGEEVIRAIQANIIYVSICGFGDQGPYANKPVYDPLIQAVSGLTTIQAGSDEVRPRLVRTILPDKLTAMTAAQAITAALLARERSGEGQHIRLSMLDSVVAFLWNSDMGSQTFVGTEIAQQKAQSFIDLIYETTDGYISVAVQSNKEWAGLTRALERPEWLEDERFKTTKLRHDNIDDRLNLTQEVLRTRSSAEWLQRLEAEDVPCAPVLKRNEVIQHPQVLANELLLESEHPHAGHLRQTRPAAQFSQTPTSLRHAAPGLGEHTDSILTELGYQASDIEELKAQGVVSAFNQEA